MALQAKGLDDLHDCGKFRVAISSKRLVETFTQ